MMALEKRIERLEEHISEIQQDKTKYYGDCVIIDDGTKTREEIERIMDERHKRSGAINFIIIPTVKPLDK